MNLLKFTRYAEWWEYKLVPLLSIGYATLLLIDIPVEIGIGRLLFLLMSIIIGATYVSVINDITDISEDALAGKSNRMANVSPVVRTIILFLCISTGVIFGYFIYPDNLGLLFYTMAWIVFSLYSIPPFRLKKRGIWGVLCDAAGAHHFPTLLITANIIYLRHTEVSVIWYWAVGIWSLFYGLRGILWHQFHDRDNDLKSGTATFASRIQPGDFKVQETLIFVIEMTAFSIVLFFIFNKWVIIGLFLYIILVLIRKISFKYEISLIITPSSRPHQLLMNDFYLVFFPLSLLFTLTLTSKYGWVVLFFHLLLFPKKMLQVLNDLLLFIKKIR